MSSTIIPCLRYENAPAMIDWLCKTFGFAPQLVVGDGIGDIAHAQLTLGTGMIMLGSARKDPAAPDGAAQGPYVVVPDIDAICDKARAAGAEIVMAPRDEDYGGRSFSCRDPEGHLWNFGSYDPWTAAH